jgi:hypothetical protein
LWVRKGTQGVTESWVYNLWILSYDIINGFLGPTVG